MPTKPTFTICDPERGSPAITRPVFAAACFGIESYTSDEEAAICFNGDVSGDGRPDILFLDVNRSTVHIYKNERGAKRDGEVPLGTGVNWTLY